MQATDRPSFVEALWDFEPDGQLTAVQMRRGDVMQVVCNDAGSGWLTVRHAQTSEQGIVPTSFCKTVAQPDDDGLVVMASAVPEAPSPAPVPGGQPPPVPPAPDSRESTALRNYEDFHNMPRGTATLGQVAGSSAGVSGWSSHEQSRARAIAAADAVLDDTAAMRQTMCPDDVPSEDGEIGRASCRERV